MKIDPEFKSLIFPLTEAEALLLEKSLIAEGCRDALVTWQGLLLDGHHRLEICQRRGIEFRTAEVELEDRTAAKAWILRNQLARRNLTPFQRAELALRLEPLIAEKAKQKQKEAGGAVHLKSNKAPVDTLKELSKIAGVGRDTIYKAKIVIEKGDEKEKEKLRVGKGKLNKVVSKIQQEEKMAILKKDYDEIIDEKIVRAKAAGTYKEFKDQWGNECYSAEGHEGILKYNSEVLRVHKGAIEEVDLRLDRCIDDLLLYLGNTISYAKNLEKYDPKEIKGAYKFYHFHNCPFKGKTSIEDSKYYLWPVIIDKFENLNKILQKIGEDILERTRKGEHG